VFIFTEAAKANIVIRYSLSVAVKANTVLVLLCTPTTTRF